MEDPASLSFTRASSKGRQGDRWASTKIDFVFFENGSRLIVDVLNRDFLVKVARYRREQPRLSRRHRRGGIHQEFAPLVRKVNPRRGRKRQVDLKASNSFKLGASYLVGSDGINLTAINGLKTIRQDDGRNGGGHRIIGIA